MAMIKELIEGKELPIKILHGGECFVVTHANKNCVLGTWETGTDSSFSLNSENWELYQEPKKTKTVYEYLFKSINFNRYWTAWFESDEDFLREWPNTPIIKTGRSHTFEVE